MAPTARDTPRGPDPTGPDLSGLDREYRYRYPRIALVLYAVVAAGSAVSFALDVAAGGRGGLLVAHGVAAGSYLLLFVVIFTATPQVVLDGDGLRVRSDYRWRTLLWAEVVEVRPDASGKFPRVWLTSGRSVRLLGVPVPAGEQLAAALQRWRHTEPGAGRV